MNMFRTGTKDFSEFNVDISEYCKIYNVCGNLHLYVEPHVHNLLVMGDICVKGLYTDINHGFRKISKPLPIRVTTNELKVIYYTTSRLEITKLKLVS